MHDNLRVVRVSYEFPPYGGGEGQYTFDLAAGLSDLGHSVVVILPKLPAQSTPYTMGRFTIIELRKIDKPFFGVSSFLSSVGQALPSIIQTEKMDLVHFTFDYPSGRIDLTDVRIPKLATLHHLHSVEARSMLSHTSNPIGLAPYVLRQYFITRAESHLLSDCDHCIAVSEFSRSCAVNELGINTSRTGVVQNGINPEPFLRAQDSALFRERFNLGERRTVLFVGRLEASKGIENQIDAFAVVKSGFTETSLVVVGHGSAAYVSKLKRRTRKRGLTNDVVFTGRLPASLLPSAYASASVVVLPSLMEGFGLTLLEAMASGRPCVASKVGGVPEVMTNGVTGILTRPGDSQDCANRISYILGNPEIAESMGKKGRKVVLSRFTAEKMCGLTADVYSKVLNSSE